MKKYGYKALYLAGLLTLLYLNGVTVEWDRSGNESVIEKQSYNFRTT
jgi:hypothetical protein